MDIKPILRSALAAQSLGLASSSLNLINRKTMNLVKKQKTEKLKKFKESKDLTKTAIRTMTGIELLRAQANLMEGM